MLLLLELPVVLCLHSPRAGCLAPQASSVFPLLNLSSFLSFLDKNLLVGKAGLPGAGITGLSHFSQLWDQHLMGIEVAFPFQFSFLLL